MVALDRNSKADTRLYLDRALAALEVDQSQELTDLGVAPTYLFEEPSARGAIGCPREIVVSADIDSTSTGILINHGLADGTDYSYRIQILAGGVVRFWQNGLIIAGGSLPLIAPAAKRYTLMWTTREGPSTDCTSVFWLYNEDDDELEVLHVEHTAATTSQAWRLTVSGYGAGVDAFSGGLAAIHRVRVGTRFHTTIEAAEDWISESIAPAPPADADPRVEGLAPPDDPGTNGSFAGPTYLHGVRSLNLNRRRLTSPLVNHVFRDQPELDYTLGPARWNIDPPGEPAGVFGLSIARLFYCRLPPVVNRARCRLFVQQWNNLGFPQTCDYRVYSFNYLPTGLGQVEDETPLRYYVEETTGVDHGALGLGEWLPIGDLKLARSPDDFTWLAVAYSIAGGLGTIQAQNQRIKIKALTVEPWAVDTTDSDFEEAAP